jgi:hypothetical protein
MNEPAVLPQPNDVRTSSVLLFGLISTVVIFALCLVLVVLYFRTEAQMRLDNEINIAPAELTQLRTEQEGKLTQYAWIDQKAGVVAIPVDLAKELVVKEIQASGKVRQTHPASK